MTPSQLARFLRQSAGRIRKEVRTSTSSLGDLFVADVEARFAERLAAMLEAIPSPELPEEKTPPVGTEVPAEAHPPKPTLREG